MNKKLDINQIVTARPIAAEWMGAPIGRPPMPMPNRSGAAIYCRFSTSQQKDTSIERQIELCSAHIAHLGLSLVKDYRDRGRSGTSTIGREGLDEMLADASRGAFSVLVVENVDRLARDLGILSSVYKKLVALGIEVHQHGRGKLHLTDIAVQGLMGDEGLRILTERTRIGKEQLARAGGFPMGPVFGYATVPGQRGVRVKEPAQAAVVERLFDMRLSGMSGRQIAFTLNREGVLNRKGHAWTRRSVDYALANPLYGGVLVYRRRRSTRQPETRKNLVYERPPSDWIVTHVPDHAIVGAEAWERVQALRPRPDKKAPRAQRPAAVYLLSCLCRCPSCGGTMTAMATGRKAQGQLRRRFACINHTSTGTCDNGRSLDVAHVDRLVMGIVAEQLLRPQFVEAYLEAYDAERLRADAAYADTRATLTRTVATLDRKLQASFDQGLTAGIVSKRAARYRQNIERELSEAEANLAALPPRPVVRGIDRPRLMSLRGAIASLTGLSEFRPADEAGFRLMASFRELIEGVVVTVNDDRSYDAEVSVRIAPLLASSGSTDPVEPATQVLRGHAPPPPRKWANDHLRLAVEARIGSGEFALSDGDWAAVRGLIPAKRSYPYAHPLDWYRPLIEACVCRLITRFPWPRIAKDPARSLSWQGAAKGLCTSGAWDRIAAVLVERDPARYEGILARQLYKPREKRR